MDFQSIALPTELRRQRGLRGPETETEMTGLEPAASALTGRRSNQLSYTSTHAPSEKWAKRDLNPRPPVCKTGALPLSYSPVLRFRCGTPTRLCQSLYPKTTAQNKVYHAGRGVSRYKGVSRYNSKLPCVPLRAHRRPPQSLQTFCRCAACRAGGQDAEDSCRGQAPRRKKYRGHGRGRGVRFGAGVLWAEPRSR